MSLLFSFTLTLLTLNGQPNSTVDAQFTDSAIIWQTGHYKHSDLVAFNVTDLRQLDLGDIEIEEDDREEETEKDATGHTQNYNSYSRLISQHRSATSGHIGSTWPGLRFVRLRC